MCPRCEVANYDPHIEDERPLWDHLHYLAGLIAKRGGGTRRSVYAQFASWLGGKSQKDNVETDELHECLQAAAEWAQRLRDGHRGTDALPTTDPDPA
jgi:hypothetical protein